MALDAVIVVMASVHHTSNASNHQSQAPHPKQTNPYPTTPTPTPPPQTNMSNPYFSASALPVPRNAGKQIADATRHLQSYSQPQKQRPASTYSTSSTSTISSRLSTWKHKLQPSQHSKLTSQHKLLQPEAINKAQMRIN